MRINRYKPDEHTVGKMPIRVLSNIVLYQFSSFSEELKDLLKDAIDFEDFKTGFLYHDDESKIIESAEIDPDSHQIHVYENFSALLWTVCYALIVIFDKGVIIPMREGVFLGKIDRRSNESVHLAFKTLEYGLSLLDSYSKWDHNLPNPENFLASDKEYIDKASSIYVAAMCFILSHEFAHHYYGHLTSEIHNTRSREEMIKDEYSADKFAVEMILSNKDEKMKGTFKLGCIAALGSIIMLDNSLKGGDSHPDSDRRLHSILKQMNLNEDSYEWGAGSLMLSLWNGYYNNPNQITEQSKTFKDTFSRMLDEVYYTKLK